MLSVKSEAGRAPEPRLWNGPWMLNVIGEVSVLEPVGVKVNPRSSTPLLTEWPPPKVCLSRVCAFDELELSELEPHADRPDAATITTRSSARRRGPQVPLGMQLSPQRRGKSGANVASRQCAGAS